MSNAVTEERTCRYPECDRPAEAADPGAGRPPEYCDDPGHTRASAWRARQRQRQEGAPGQEEPRPVDAARQRAGQIAAQVSGMTEHLVVQLGSLLEQLRTVGDPDAAQAQMESVASEAAEQVAAANARATRAELSLRKAMADTDEADAAAAEATHRADDLEAMLAQVNAELAGARSDHEHLLAAHTQLGESLDRERARTAALTRDLDLAHGELTQARADRDAALGEKTAHERARIEAEQRTAAATARAEAEAVRATKADEATTQVRQQLDHLRAGIDAAREQAGELRATIATLTAQRDAARADAARESTHGEQRVQDLHATYSRQIADLRAASTDQPTTRTSTRNRSRKAAEPPAN